MSSIKTYKKVAREQKVQISTHVRIVPNKKKDHRKKLKIDDL